MSADSTVSRRTVLRGIGTAMALPLLDAMAPSVARAARAAKTPPTRMAFVFVPNGKHMPDWTPTVEGRDFDLPPILEPLAGVKDSLNVFSGLTHDEGRAKGDGPGDHARAASTNASRSPDSPGRRHTPGGGGASRASWGSRM